MADVCCQGDWWSAVQVRSPFADLSNGRLSPLANALLQEVDGYNSLQAVVAGSLHELQQAIQGWVVMSDALEATLRMLQSNQVCFATCMPSCVTR